MRKEILFGSRLLAGIVFLMPQPYLSERPSFASAPNQAAASERACSETPLVAAIKKRDVIEVRKILSSKPNLKALSCPEGRPALSESIALGFTEIAREVLLSGANPELPDATGVTPLMFASFHCNEDVTRLLLDRRVSVDAIDNEGFSSLMSASQGCRDGRLVALLLRARANPNLRAKDGQTALTIAAFSGNEQSVQELVAAGANLNNKTQDGETALDLAQQRAEGQQSSYDRIVAFLKLVSGM